MNDKPTSAANSLPPSMDAPIYVPSNPEADAAAAESHFQELRKLRAERREIEAKGREALGRLMKVAMRDTGQSRKIASFLLSCYNGQRFPFDLTDFRGLDFSLFADCLTVLKMDYQPAQEVHVYFDHGGELFERLARDHGITDVLRLKHECSELKARLGSD